MRKDSFDIFIEEGDKLFNYMVNNFDTMFNKYPDTNKEYINHFVIIHGIYAYIVDMDEFNDEYNVEIQPNLIDWIKNEHKENRLFDKNNWKPFRDQYEYIDMQHYGYKQLFQFKHYYFQLGIKSYCDIYECLQCNEIISNNTKDKDDEYVKQYLKDFPRKNIHFILALYGWKDDNSDMLQPYESVKLPVDNNLCTRHWNLR